MVENEIERVRGEVKDLRDEFLAFRSSYTEVTNKYAFVGDTERLDCQRGGRGKPRRSVGKAGAGGHQLRAHRHKNRGR